MTQAAFSTSLSEEKKLNLKTLNWIEIVIAILFHNGNYITE